MIVAPIVINRIVNKKIQTRLQQDPNNKLRDVELEGTAYHKVLPFCLLGLLSFYMAVYHFDLNTLTFSRPMVDVPHLQLHQAETVFVDNRFNCLRCNYSLKREDRIVFKKENGQEFLGRLIGVPGEVVQINNKGTDGRYIASTEEIKIPEGKVAVRVNPDGSALTLVNVDQIRGRITTDLSHFLYPSIKDKY